MDHILKTICDKHPLLMSRTLVSDQGAQGPLVSSSEPLAHGELL